MTTPTHVAASVGVFLIATQIESLNPNYIDLALVVGANFIDLDHLFSRPIYDPKRNSFKSHFLHRHWKIVSLLSLGMLFIRPLAFLGIGILLHFFLDYLYNKREKIEIRRT